MHYNRISLVLGALLFAVQTAVLGNPQLPDYLKNAVEKLKSTQGEVRMEGYNTILEWRGQHVGALMEVAGDRHAPLMGRAKAMEILGAHRATEAIDTLAQEIKMSYWVAQSSFRPPVSRAPAREALAKIGRPVVPRMIDLIARDSDPEVREYSRSVISGVIATMPDNAREKFLKEQLGKTMVVLGAKGVRDVTDQIIEHALKTYKPVEKKSNEIIARRSTATPRLEFVEMLRDLNERIQDNGSKQIMYLSSVIRKEISHKIINDREGLPPSKRLAWDILYRYGALVERWEEQLHKK